MASLSSFLVLVVLVTTVLTQTDSCDNQYDFVEQLHQLIETKINSTLKDDLDLLVEAEVSRIVAGGIDERIEGKVNRTLSSELQTRVKEHIKVELANESGE